MAPSKTTTEMATTSATTPTIKQSIGETSETPKYITEIVLKQLNQTARTHGEILPESSTTPGLNHHQFNTVLYIGLSLFCVVCLGLISALYVRNANEKRRSRQAIRSLLDLVAENNSVNNSHSINGVYTLSESHNFNNIVDPDCSSNSSCESDKTNGFGIYIQSNMAVMESRLKMPPLENTTVTNLPSPHLSAPVLPPIKKAMEELKPIQQDVGFASLRRPKSTLKVVANPDSSSIRAISHSLSKLHSGLIESAASFPDDDTEGQFTIKLPDMDKKDESDNCDFAVTRM